MNNSSKQRVFFLTVHIAVWCMRIQGCRFSPARSYLDTTNCPMYVCCCTIGFFLRATRRIATWRHIFDVATSICLVYILYIISLLVQSASNRCVWTFADAVSPQLVGFPSKILVLGLIKLLLSTAKPH